MEASIRCANRSLRSRYRSGTLCRLQSMRNVRLFLSGDFAMLRRWIFAFAIVVTVTSCYAAEDKEKPGHSLDLATQKVIIFKDGYCLFHKQGQATTDKASECFTDD